MSRALTVIAVALLWSTASCIHPHLRHSSRHHTRGSVRVGWRHPSPPPVVHSHGHGCGHVRIGLEWVLSSPGTRHGSVTPPPMSTQHDRGLHGGQEGTPPRVEHSEVALVEEVVSVLHDVAHESEQHAGHGKGHDKQGHSGNAKGHGKAKGHDQSQG